MQKGIEYKVTGEQERGRMANYHYKPNALFLNKTSHKVDVAGLKKVDQRSIKFDGVEYESKFTIGIEVERKTSYLVVLFGSMSYSVDSSTMALADSRRLAMCSPSCLLGLGAPRCSTWSTRPSVSLRTDTAPLIRGVVAISP